MKKLSLALALLVFLTALVPLSLIPAAAESYPAPDESVIKDGEAQLDIQYTEKSPVIDGKVEKDEYTQIPNNVLFNYYNYCVATELKGLTQEEKYEILKDYAMNDMAVYANWDGRYLYFAVTALATPDEYTCPKAADSVNLFRYWCLQIGAAAPYAVGSDRFEVGIGASSDPATPDACYAFDAWGSRFFNNFREGTEYAAHWDTENMVVTYEVRLNIREVIGHTPVTGDQMRFLYLLSQSGQVTQNASDNIQIQCGYGCAQEKNVEWYLMLNFVGESGTVDPGEEETEIVEEELPGFWGKTDFRKPEVCAYLTVANDCDYEPRTDDNGDTYVRLTCRGKDPYIGGPKIPIGLNADSVRYIAVKYRTTAPSARWLGFSYQSLSYHEQSDSFLFANDDDLICDGEWHISVIEIYDAPYWNAFITDMLLWPFQDDKALQVGDVIDVMWLRYYTAEPAFEEETAKPGSSTSPAETAAPEPETGDTAASPVTGDVTAPVTSPETEASASSGCSSVMGLAALTLLLPAAALTLRRKKD